MKNLFFFFTNSCVCLVTLSTCSKTDFRFVSVILESIEPTSHSHCYKWSQWVFSFLLKDKVCIISELAWVHLLVLRYSRPSDRDPGRGTGGGPLQKPCHSALQHQPCGDLLLETVWRCWTQLHSELLLAALCSGSLPDFPLVTQSRFSLMWVSQSAVTR